MIQQAGGTFKVYPASRVSFDLGIGWKKFFVKIYKIWIKNEHRECPVLKWKPNKESVHCIPSTGGQVNIDKHLKKKFENAIQGEIAIV